MEAAERAERGTEVTLHLREGEDELANAHRLRNIVRKYSDHILIPIVMKQEEWDKDNRVYRTTGEDETVNQASALWARPRNEITEEQYREFYRHVSHDSEAPLAWAHAKVEGRKEFIQLLYVPARAPFDLGPRPSAARRIPAFTASSLYFCIATNASGFGRSPGPGSFFAMPMTLKPIGLS